MREHFRELMKHDLFPEIEELAVKRAKELECKEHVIDVTKHHIFPEIEEEVKIRHHMIFEKEDIKKH